jgi:hypothetical protein
MKGTDSGGMFDSNALVGFPIASVDFWPEAIDPPDRLRGGTRMLLRPTWGPDPSWAKGTGPKPQMEETLAHMERDGCHRGNPQNRPTAEIQLDA